MYNRRISAKTLVHQRNSLHFNGTVWKQLIVNIYAITAKQTKSQWLVGSDDIGFTDARTSAAVRSYTSYNNISQCLIATDLAFRTVEFLMVGPTS